MDALIRPREAASEHRAVLGSPSIGVLFDAMRRPSRTRRLSISATMSIAIFVVVAGAGVRSFLTWDALDFGVGNRILISHGYLQYSHTWISQAPGYPVQPQSLSHESGHDLSTPGSLGRHFMGFSYSHIKASQTSNCLDVYELWIPLWFPLLLLFLAPLRWLIAQHTYVRAFPVLNDAKHGNQ